MCPQKPPELHCFTLALLSCLKAYLVLVTSQHVGKHTACPGTDSNKSKILPRQQVGKNNIIVHHLKSLNITHEKHDDQPFPSEIAIRQASIKNKDEEHNRERKEQTAKIKINNKRTILKLDKHVFMHRSLPTM